MNYKLLEYAFKRIGSVFITLLGMSILIFALTQILPGNPAELILGRYATEESIAALEREMGLNRPLYVQYFDWLSSALVGDFGRSHQLDQSVSSMVAPRLIRSGQLAALTLILVLVISIPIGVLVALYRDTWVDRTLLGVTYAGVSLPEFVTGTLLLLLLAGPVFSVLPTSGYVAFQDDPVEWFRHLVLPATTGAIMLVAHVARQTRQGMIETFQSEYIRTARLKGLSESTVILKHGLRNGLVATVTVLAFSIGWLMGGLVVIEEVFAYPGLGRLMVGAIHDRDLPVVQATVLIVAAAYAFSNMLADILYGIMDPRTYE